MPAAGPGARAAAANIADELAARGAEILIAACTEIPLVLDAKRGDIGATAEQYAREAFERYRADAVTLNPYMGFDSIAPFLNGGIAARFCCAAHRIRAVPICSS